MAELVAANPGMKSRFPKSIHFPDYSAEELVAILRMTASKGALRAHRPRPRPRPRRGSRPIPRDEGFGNGRLVRNLFETAVGRQATRLAGVEHPTDEQLLTLEAADFLEPGDLLLARSAGGDERRRRRAASATPGDLGAGQALVGDGRGQERRSSAG